MKAIDYVALQTLSGRVRRERRDVIELGGRAARAIYNENCGGQAEQERVVRHRAIDAVVAATIRNRARAA